MPNDLQKILTQEIKNHIHDVETLEFQLAEKRKTLDLLNEIIDKLKAAAAQPLKRHTRQRISEMIIKILLGRRKPVHPKQLIEALNRAGYIGSPTVMYATLSRLVRTNKIIRNAKGGYTLSPM